MSLKKLIRDRKQSQKSAAAAKAAAKAREEEDKKKQSEALRQAKARLDEQEVSYVLKDLLLTPDMAQQLVEEGHAVARCVPDDVVLISKAKEEEVFKQAPGLRDCLVFSRQKLWCHMGEARLEREADITSDRYRTPDGS